MVLGWAVLYAPGVPSRMTAPGTSCFSRAARRARATATPAIAIRLCPQPCPIPGSASISAFTPTIRPTPRAPRLNSARQAVSRPRYCRVTVNPREDMKSVRRSCAYLCVLTLTYYKSAALLPDRLSRRRSQTEEIFKIRRKDQPLLKIELGMA